MLLLLSHFSRVWFCATPQTAAHRFHHPWDSLGKNTGVGCHLLLQCMKVKSESEVAQLCPTLSDPMDCSPPGSFVHGIFQARVLEWGASAFSVSRHSDHLKCKSALIIPPQNIPVLLQLSQNNWQSLHYGLQGTTGVGLALALILPLSLLFTQLQPAQSLCCSLKTPCILPPSIFACAVPYVWNASPPVPWMNYSLGFF